MSSDAVIEVQGLGKRYEIYAQPRDRLRQMVVPSLRRALGLAAHDYFKEFWALRDVSFSVRRGETVAIVGQNGSGKSTLLQLVCGTLSPTTGGVRIAGRIAALLELGAGFNTEFSGRENVFLSGLLYGISREELARRYDSIVAFAEIGEFIDQPVKTYSSGMLVRLAFAVIAHVDADILVIDEALAVGDAFFTQKCMRFLREFMKTGTVLFVSHDTNAVKNLCNHAIWLDKGRLRQQGTPKDVCEAYLREFYAQQQANAPGDPGSDNELLAAAEQPQGDQRLPWLNASNLRNDLQVFAFDPQAASFGAGGARIVDVSLCDSAGQSLAWAVGGEAVRLRIMVKAVQPLQSPILGFVVKDRLGQVLFGENTYLDYQDDPVPCEAGQTLVAEFDFWMPRMPAGDYTITASVADGTQQDHVQHHWVFDALAFRSECTSASAGLVGLPMRGVRLRVHGAPS